MICWVPFAVASTEGCAYRRLINVWCAACHVVTHLADYCDNKTHTDWVLLLLWSGWHLRSELAALDGPHARSSRCWCTAGVPRDSFGGDAVDAGPASFALRVGPPRRLFDFTSSSSAFVLFSYSDAFLAASVSCLVFARRASWSAAICSS
jgi:hypothetical protein